MNRLVLALLLALSLRSFAAISLVQTKTCSVVVSSGSGASCTFSTSPTAGDTVLVAVGGPMNSASYLATVADNQMGNSYASLALADGAHVGGGTTIASQIFAGYAVNSAGTFTVTVSWTGGYLGEVTTILAEYSGLSGILDTTSAIAYYGAASTVPCSTVNTSNANDLIFAAAGVWAGTGTLTAVSSGFTLEGTNPTPNAGVSAIAGQITSATGPFTATFTSTASDSNRACAVVALEAAVSPSSGRLLHSIN